MYKSFVFSRPSLIANAVAAVLFLVVAVIVARAVAHEGLELMLTAAFSGGPVLLSMAMQSTALFEIESKKEFFLKMMLAGCVTWVLTLIQYFIILFLAFLV